MKKFIILSIIHPILTLTIICNLCQVGKFYKRLFILSYIFLQKKRSKRLFGYPILSSIKYTRWILMRLKRSFVRRNIALISRDLMSIFSRHPIYFINPYETRHTLTRKKEIIRSVIRGLCINLAAYCRSLFPHSSLSLIPLPWILLEKLSYNTKKKTIKRKGKKSDR